MGFKNARKNSGMTQMEAAKAFGTDQSTVCLWETGKTKPRADLLPRIAEVYGCTVDELLSGAPEE